MRPEYLNSERLGVRAQWLMFDAAAEAVAAGADVDGCVDAQTTAAPRRQGIMVCAGRPDRPREDDGACQGWDRFDHSDSRLR